jgi:hypothetical protein
MLQRRGSAFIGGNGYWKLIEEVFLERENERQNLRTEGRRVTGGKLFHREERPARERDILDTSERARANYHSLLVIVFASVGGLLAFEPANLCPGHLPLPCRSGFGVPAALWPGLRSCASDGLQDFRALASSYLNAQLRSLPSPCRRSNNSAAMALSPFGIAASDALGGNIPLCLKPGERTNNSAMVAQNAPS